jgi:hypothetical protein
VAEHKARFREFWQSTNTPAEICEELGDQGQKYLACAAESVEHIARLAAIHGKTLVEVIPPEHFVPPLAFTFLSEGRIAVVEVEGLDAWGRPIVEPEEDPTE